MFIRGFRVAANAVKNGAVVEIRGNPYFVLSHTRIGQGRGSASIKFELKHVTTGSKATERISANDNLEQLDLENKSCTYLYHTNDEIVFNGSEGEFSVPIHLCQNKESALKLFQANVPIAVGYCRDKPVSIRIPVSVLNLEIEEGEQITSSTGYKPVTVNGIRVDVPQFVKPGDRASFQVDDDYKLTYLRRI